MIHSIKIKQSQISANFGIFDCLKTVELDCSDNTLTNYDRYLSDPHSGRTYNVVAINGIAVSRPVFLHWFWHEPDNIVPEGFTNLQNTQDIIAFYIQMLESDQVNIFQNWQVFMLFPLASFSGELYQLPVWAYLSLLPDLDWMSLVQLQEKSRMATTLPFYEQKFSKKREIALKLIEALQVLNSCGLVFTGIDERSFFVNENTGQLAFNHFEKLRPIDIDVKSAYEQNPVWEPQEKHPDMNWQIALLSYALCYPFPPYYVLKKHYSADINTYLSKCQWPTIPVVNRGPVALFRHFRNLFALNIPALMNSAFTETFNKGYGDQNARPPLPAWFRLWRISEEVSHKARLSAIAPQVSFSADKEVIITGMPVLLHWQIDGSYSKARLKGYGDVRGLQKLEVWPELDTNYELEVTGPFGELIYCLSIVVYPKPILENITPPEINLEPFLALQLPTPMLPEINIPLQELKITIPEVDLSWEPEVKIPEIHIQLPKSKLALPDWQIIAPENLPVIGTELIQQLGLGSADPKYHQLTRLYKKINKLIKKWSMN